MRDLLRPSDELTGYVPDFSYQICDLGAWTDEELRGAALTRAVLLTLKYIARDEFADRLPEILGLFRDLMQQPAGLASLVTLLTYISSATDRGDKEQLTIAVRQNLGRSGEELMPTIAQQWRNEALEEGLQRGRAEGREEGLRTGIRAVLELRFPQDAQSIGNRLGAVHSVESLTGLLKLSKSASTSGELTAFLDRTCGTQ